MESRSGGPRGPKTKLSSLENSVDNAIQSFGNSFISIVQRSDIFQHEALLAGGIGHDDLVVVTGKDTHAVFLDEAPDLESGMGPASRILVEQIAHEGISIACREINVI